MLWGMKDMPSQRSLPAETQQARAERLAREERQAAALRANLYKRKQQARDRLRADLAPDGQ